MTCMSRFVIISFYPYVNLWGSARFYQISSVNHFGKWRLIEGTFLEIIEDRKTFMTTSMPWLLDFPDNCLTPGRCQAIAWTNTGLLIAPKETKCIEIRITLRNFIWRICIWKYRLQNVGHFCRPPYVCYIMDTVAGLILGLCQTNERRRYKVTPSLIGWAET